MLYSTHVLLLLSTLSLSTFKSYACIPTLFGLAKSKHGPANPDAAWKNMEKVYVQEDGALECVGPKSNTSLVSQFRIELLHMKDEKVVRHKSFIFARNGTRSGHLNWIYERKGTCLNNEDHFCHRIDKIIVWFDGAYPRYSDRFLIWFKGNNSTFEFKIPKLEPKSSLNWFGAGFEESNKDCNLYLKDANGKENESDFGRKEFKFKSAYYLISKTGGIERIMNEDDHWYFVNGRKKETELRINCEMECPSMHKTFL
ncbi:hypothetical protein L596_019607 [Steinernema carpocapsae]|nr:hypothetical protein L596_019607 [Steinernema carpocapsae]